MALDQRPDLAASDAQIRAAQAQVDAVRAAGLPTISFGANVGATHSWQQSAELYSDSIGISISVPIFTGYQSTYQIAQAKAQKEQKQADRAQLAQSIALQVWNAYQDLVTQDRALATALDLLASAEQSERVALGRYKAGIGNILEVLTAQSALASARQQEVLARYQLALAKVTLIHALGGLELATFANSGR
jgi:outer membrane protein TolC